MIWTLSFVHPNYEIINLSISSKASDLLIPLIIASIGLVGGLLGVYVGASLNSNISKEMLQISYQNQILQQRIKLIDRAALIYGKAPGVSDLWSDYRKNPSIELSKDLSEYNSEFNAVIHLSDIYFGPKTKAALTEMTVKDSPWWEKNKELVGNYIGAMSSELNHGIE